MVAFHVHNLCKRFNKRIVLHDISFSHSEGILGVTGPNGSGKSTLLQCLTGLLNLSKGRIAWQKEEEAMTIAEVKLQLGYVAPYINLYHELSCRENLNFLLKLRNHKTRGQKIEDILTKTGAIALADQPFGNLSTGQQQRIRLAAALVHQPNVLFLDEPGSNLDNKGSALVQSVISRFKDEQKLVVIASNNAKELELCDRLYSVEEAQFMLR